MTGGRYEVVVPGRLGPITRTRFADFVIEERQDVLVVLSGSGAAVDVLERLAGLTGVHSVRIVRGPGNDLDGGAETAR